MRLEHEAGLRSLSDQGGNVRFGSLADICSANAVQKGMSALPPIATAKADMPQMVMSALPPRSDNQRPANRIGADDTVTFVIFRIA